MRTTVCNELQKGCDFLLPTRTVSLPIAGFLFLLRSWNMPGSLLLAPTAYPSKLVDFLTRGIL